MPSRRPKKDRNRTSKRHQLQAHIAKAHEHLLAARVLLGIDDDGANVETEALDAALRDDVSYVTTRSDFRRAVASNPSSR